MLEEELKDIYELCVNCRLCLKHCEFLNSLFETRDELVGDLESEGASPKTLYSCTMCDLCETICPSELNIGRAYLKLRQEKGPLPVQKKFIDKDQEWVLSDKFALSLPDPDSSECRQVFFPGCNLVGYSVDLVMKTYEHLKSKLPGTAILLGCCGASRRECGEDVLFKETADNVEAEVKKLGASEIIVACPNCRYALTEHERSIKIRSVYEILDEIDLPEMARGDERTFNVHDPCRARWQDEMQDAARNLIAKSGHKIEEMQYSRDLTMCCGLGGQIPFANLPLSKSMARNRAQQAELDIVTYCASCRDALAPYKPTLHVLDLIFNSEWDEARVKPAHKPSEARANQTLLRAQLLEKFGR